MRRVGIILVAVVLTSNGLAEVATVQASAPPSVTPAAVRESVLGRPRTLDPHVFAQAKAEANAAAAAATSIPAATTGPSNGGVYDGQNSAGILGDGRDTPPDPTGSVGLFLPLSCQSR